MALYTYTLNVDGVGEGVFRQVDVSTLDRAIAYGTVVLTDPIQTIGRFETPSCPTSHDNVRLIDWSRAGRPQGLAGGKLMARGSPIRVIPKSGAHRFACDRSQRSAVTAPRVAACH